jgi:hypothetical protein
MIAKRSIVLACAMLAMATAPGRSAEPCADIERARQSTYVPFAKLIVDDVNAIRKSTPSASFNAALQTLSGTYARAARFGDMLALRKLIGLGLFTAYAAHTAPPETTFKLVCELARRSPQPALTLDPLTCAVVAIDGARRDDQRNRELANQMLDLAKGRMASDPNGPAAHALFDGILPIVAACSAE